MRQHVPANEASTGPKVISLNQVDDQAWGAAALDPEAGCLLVLVDVSSGLRKAAQLRYGKGAADQPCTAKQITRTVVTNPERGAWGCRLRNAGRIPGC